MSACYLTLGPSKAGDLATSLDAGWLLSADPCTWFGVTCSSGHVIWLKLPTNNLTGSIPPELGNLTALEVLDLRLNSFLGNQLSGPIPAELGNLTALMWLNLRSNNLTGSIPAELGNLTSLLYLDLDRNNLTGSIPAELGNLTSLISLDLARNNLTGSIPVELGNLTSLTSLHLDFNQLSGLVPLPVAGLGGEIQQTHSLMRCRFESNPGLFMPDSQDYMDADLDNDGFICGIALSPPAP